MKNIIFLLTVIYNSKLILSFSVNLYYVPDAKIEVFTPSGFRASIPHEEGVEVFEFHGNVNRPIRTVEAGDIYGKGVNSNGKQWIFEDYNTELKKGDIIYYWTFIIKKQLGYRRQMRAYVVDDIKPRNEVKDSDNHHTPTVPTTTQSNLVNNNDALALPICAIALNLTNTVDYLTNELKELKEVTSLMRQIMATDDRITKTLKFEGILPEENDAQYTAQLIINEKMGVKVQVVNATWIGAHMIEFQVANLDDKIFLIRRAKLKLENSKIKLTF